jgi:tRNA A37 threonylcarbamoyladenosine synthetase subunit TsaC/SUA5/YrdC
VTYGSLNAVFFSRRRLLQTLSVVATQIAVACRPTDQEHDSSIEELRNLSKVHGSKLTVERLEAIKPLLDSQFSQIEALRRFELDERVEPATVFLAKR